jgi:hypothetical protein
MTRAGGWLKMGLKRRKEFPMNNMPLIHALLFSRPPEWNIERAPQIYDPQPAFVPLKHILLACL